MGVSVGDPAADKTAPRADFSASRRVKTPTFVGLSTVMNAGLLESDTGDVPLKALVKVGSDVSASSLETLLPLVFCLCRLVVRVADSIGILDLRLVSEYLVTFLESVDTEVSDDG